MGDVRVSWFGVGLALLAAMVAVPVLLIAAIRGFDGLYGQDSFAYVDYALGPLRAALLAGHAPPDFPLPPGYPLLVALTSIVVGPSDGLARALSLGAGAALPILIALLARELLPDRDIRLALLAGLVAAVAGQLWQSSLVSMPDTPAAAAATLGALAACRYHRIGGRTWLAMASAALALAIETRVIYGAVALVFAVVAIARWRDDVRMEPRRAIAGACVAAVAGLVILAPTLAAIGIDLAAGRPLPFAAEFGVTTFDLTTPFRSTFETADGHLAYNVPMIAWYAIEPARWYWFAALALALPVGLAASLRRHERSTAEGATLIAWPAIVGLVLIFYPYQNPRFFLAVLPPLVILAAVGLSATWRLLAAAPRIARTTALAVAALAIGANAGLAWRYTSEFAAGQSADLDAIRALATEIPPGAAVTSIGATPVLRHDGRQVTELYNLSPAGADELARGSRVYVIVEAAAMAGQWAGTRTGDAFSTIAAAPGFAVVDRAGSWTLYAGGG